MELGFWSKPCSDFRHFKSVVSISGVIRLDNCFKYVNLSGYKMVLHILWYYVF